MQMAPTTATPAIFRQSRPKTPEPAQHDHEAYQAPLPCRQPNLWMLRRSLLLLRAMAKASSTGPRLPSQQDSAKPQPGWRLLAIITRRPAQPFPPSRKALSLTSTLQINPPPIDAKSSRYTHKSSKRRSNGRKTNFFNKASMITIVILATIAVSELLRV